MDIRRIILYMALALVGLSLWNAWQIDYPVKPAIVQNPASQLNNDGHLLPQLTPTTGEQSAITPTSVQPVADLNSAASIIQVKTDVLNIGIDLKQGDIVNGQLLDYPESVDAKNIPFTLLQNN